MKYPTGVYNQLAWNILQYFYERKVNLEDYKIMFKI